jgi:phosphate transport system permease protein
MAGKRLGNFLRAAVELLAGIPSVIYGLFGIAVVVPLVRMIPGGNGIPCSPRRSSSLL